uniref:Uncharacterized protein n=1 Tax=Pyramimonas obovata TaxID=1411642 RepID=A0A7S0QYD1_9CHLO|mmetsp:Transcript_18220/g.39842  ORF Transcript_18220/g.39842 Transcript_18220/m.39842 type:complete len:440 (+) Transcript_18220:105-1424(+)
MRDPSLESLSSHERWYTQCNRAEAHSLPGATDASMSLQQLAKAQRDAWNGQSRKSIDVLDALVCQARLFWTSPRVKSVRTSRTFRVSAPSYTASHPEDVLIDNEWSPAIRCQSFTNACSTKNSWLSEETQSSARRTSSARWNSPGIVNFSSKEGASTQVAGKDSLRVLVSVLLAVVQSIIHLGLRTVRVLLRTMGKPLSTSHLTRTWLDTAARAPQCAPREPHLVAHCPERTRSPCEGLGGAAAQMPEAQTEDTSAGEDRRFPSLGGVSSSAHQSVTSQAGQGHSLKSSQSSSPNGRSVSLDHQCCQSCFVASSSSEWRDSERSDRAAGTSVWDGVQLQNFIRSGPSMPTTNMPPQYRRHSLPAMIPAHDTHSEIWVQRRVCGLCTELAAHAHQHNSYTHGSGRPHGKRGLHVRQQFLRQDELDTPQSMRWMWNSRHLL